MTEKGEFNLPSDGAPDDSAYEKVITVQAQNEELRRELAALKKDQKQILSEYQDMVNCRKVPRSPLKITSRQDDLLEMDAGDVHGMVQDPAAVAGFFAVVEMPEPHRIPLGGDIITCDGWLSKSQPLYVADMDYTYQEDIGAGNDFLDRIQEAAPNAVIEMLEGNHEWHIERWAVDQTGNKRDAQMLIDAFGPARLLRLEDRGVTYYRRSIQHTKNAPPGWVKRGKIWYVHEASGGKNAAASSMGMTAGNVVFYHTHKEDSFTKVFPGVGICKAFSPGCLCQRYALYNHSQEHSWTHGYGITYVSVKTGNFQRIHVPIWEGKSLASSMIERFKS